ncbi:hypothetical protein GCM10027048_05120 [Hymenobacter coalescens]
MGWRASSAGTRKNGKAGMDSGDKRGNFSKEGGSGILHLPAPPGRVTGSAQAAAGQRRLESPRPAGACETANGLVKSITANKRGLIPYGLDVAPACSPPPGARPTAPAAPWPGPTETNGLDSGRVLPG